MVQRSLAAWAVRAPLHDDGAADAARAELQRRQQAQAESVGLEWPRRGVLPKKRVGRPTRQSLWEDLLYIHITQGTLPAGVTRAVPAWWRDGMAINQTCGARAGSCRRRRLSG